MIEWLPVAVALTALATAAGALCGNLVQKGYRLGRWIALLSEQVLSNGRRIEELEKRLEAFEENPVRRVREEQLQYEIESSAKNKLF